MVYRNAQSCVYTATPLVKGVEFIIYISIVLSCLFLSIFFYRAYYDWESSAEEFQCALTAGLCTNGL